MPLGAVCSRDNGHQGAWRLPQRGHTGGASSWLSCPRDTTSALMVTVSATFDDAAGEPFTTSFGRVKRPVVTRAANLPTRPS